MSKKLVTRRSLEYKKDQRKWSVETLGVSGHGDNYIIVNSPKKVKQDK